MKINLELIEIPIKKNQCPYPIGLLNQNYLRLEVVEFNARIKDKPLSYNRISDSCINHSINKEVLYILSPKGAVIKSTRHSLKIPSNLLFNCLKNSANTCLKIIWLNYILIKQHRTKKNLKKMETIKNSIITWDVMRVKLWKRRTQ